MEYDVEFVKVKDTDTDYERVKFLYNNILRERQVITYMKRKECQTVGDN